MMLAQNNNNTHEAILAVVAMPLSLDALLLGACAPGVSARL